MWNFPLRRWCIRILGRRGYARYGCVNLSLSQLLTTILFCSVVVLTAFTQAGLFTTHTAVPMSMKLLLRDVYVPGFENPIPDLCLDNGTSLTVVIVVTSAPQHSNHRMAIRNTWASFPRHKDYRVAFIVGRHPDPVVRRLLAEEGALYNDVIISRNADTYWNLILKTASILEWASTFCRHASYILKADDDVFVNVPKLKEFIQKTSKSESNIYGNLVVKDHPIRKFTSKNYVSEEDFSGPVWPDYMGGWSGYWMTVEVAEVLYEAALNSTFFNVEDVFFTGVVAPRAGVGLVAIPEHAYILFASKLDRREVSSTVTFLNVKVLDQYYIFSLLRNT